MSEAPKTAADVKEFVREHEIRFIRFWFTDILGQLKSFSINAAELDDAFEAGMGFDGSSITGFNAIEESDMVAMPDPATFVVLPWRPGEQGVGRMFCDIATPERTPYEGDPRHVLRRAIERVPRRWASTPSTSARSSSTTCSATARSTEVLDEGGYFDLTTLDAGSDVRRETVLALEQLGIHVEYTHHEVGPSQHEIDMRYADALKMADDCMTYRITVKEYAIKYGWHATFMPKPLFGENGSGMHTHHSLFRDGRNAFFDADDQYFLSDVGKAFIAGQLRHARENLLDLRPVGQLLQAPRAGLRGADVRRLVAPQPLGAGARAAVPPGPREGDAHGAALPGPGLQPVPDLRGAAAGGPGGDREGLRAARADGAEPLPPLAARSTGAWASSSSRRALGEAIELTAESELVLRTLGEHTFNRYVEIKRQRVGRLPRAGHAVGA